MCMFFQLTNLTDSHRTSIAHHLFFALAEDITSSLCFKAIHRARVHDALSITLYMTVMRLHRLPTVHGLTLLDRPPL
jgi:hypothetical protein